MIRSFRIKLYQSRCYATSKSKVWSLIRNNAADLVNREPILQEYLNNYILKHETYQQAIISSTAYSIESKMVSSEAWKEILMRAEKESLQLSIDFVRNSMEDLIATEERDPACHSILQAFLYFKGFKASTCYRFSHLLWLQGRHDLALLLQSKCSEQFGVDIHPAARIGGGVMFDHATGIVIGETSVVGNDCSFLHGVTLGSRGTSKDHDRHPKIGNDVIIGCMTSVLGNISIGDHCRIGTGSIVLSSLPAGSTAVGAPAKVVNTNRLQSSQDSSVIENIDSERRGGMDVFDRVWYPKSLLH